MGKRKFSFIGACVLALAISGCSSVVNYLIPNKQQLNTGYSAATMAGGTNGSVCEVNGKSGIKVGTSKKGGDMTVTIPAATTDLTVYCAAWNGVNDLSLNITTDPEATITPKSISLTSDTGVANNTPFTLKGDESNYKFDFTLSGVSASTTVKFETASGKRFVMWDAQYKIGGSTDVETCTVTFVSNGGSEASPITITKGDKIPHENMPYPTKEEDTENQIRYSFFGWYTTPTFDEGTEFTSNTAVTEDLIVYAKYTAKHYYIIHAENNNGTSEDHKIDDGVNGYVPTPIKACYVLAGWYTTPTFDEGTEFINDSHELSSNITVYAKWELTTEYSELDKYHFSNGLGYRVIAEVTAITSNDTYFIQSQGKGMIVRDTTYINDIQVGNTIDIAAEFYTTTGIWEFINVQHLEVTSNDTVISETPITDITKTTDNVYDNHSCYFEISGIELGSGFDEYRLASIVGSDAKLYYSDTNHVNGGNFDPADYKSADLVSVKGVMFRYKNGQTIRHELYITSIAKLPSYEVTFVANPDNPTSTTASTVQQGVAVARPADPSVRKDENYIYTFVNWFLNPDDAEPYDFNTPVTEPITLYGRWSSSPRAAKEVVNEDLYCRAFLNYSYEKVGDNGFIDTLDQTTTGVEGKNYTDWTNNTSKSGIAYAGQSAADYNTIQLRSNNSNSGIIVTANTHSYGAYKVTVWWNANTADGRELQIFGKDSAYTSPTELYDENKQGTLLGTLKKDSSLKATLELDGTYTYIGLRSKSSAQYIQYIDIQWGDDPERFEYSNVTLRFSGFISTSLWNRLDTESTIEGYGVMIAKTDDINDASLKALEPNGTTVRRYYTEITDSHKHPTLANDKQKGNRDGDYYIWNLKKAIGNDELTTKFTALAFIVVDGETLFMSQTVFSAKSLANNLLNNKIYPEDYDEGALANLAKVK